MTTTQTLHPVPAPKFAQFHAYNCTRCGHEELLHPVFLSDGNAYGTDCAGQMMGTDGREAARQTIEAESDVTIPRAMFSYLNICRPGRITSKFVAEMKDRYMGLQDEQVERAIALWKAAK